MEQNTEMNNERIYGKDSGFMGKDQGKTLELQAGQDKKICSLLVVYFGGRCFEYDGGESKREAFDYAVESRQGLSGDVILKMKIL